jgi:hypothetical protein
MGKNELTGKINNKTVTTFFGFFLAYLMISIVISAVSLQIHPEEYHARYFSDYMFNNSIFIFFKYFFMATLVCYAVCYSLALNENIIPVKSSGKIIFYDVIKRGLVLLVLLTFVFFLGQEFVIPSAQNKLEILKDNTVRAKNLLDKGNEYYSKKDVMGSLRCYEEYIKLVDDSVIKDRVRTLNVQKKKILADIEKNNASNRIMTEDTTVPKTITDYYQLGEIYFQKEDYLTALYYFQYAVNGNIGRKQDAENRIAEINRILRFRNSLMSDSAFSQMMQKEDQKNKKIYSMKNEAKGFVDEKDYQKALFVYNDILKINSALRDTVQDQNDAYEKISASSVELSDIENKRLFSGKSNLCFMYTPNILMNIGYILKVVDLDTLESGFYLYDVRFYKFNANFKTMDTVFAPYGQAKSPVSFTLYCYSFQDRNIEFFPIPETMEKYYYNRLLEKADAEDRSYLNNLYTDNGSSIKLVENPTNENLIAIGKILNRLDFNAKTLLFDKQYERFDNIYSLPVDMVNLFNFSYNYEKALNYSLVKLFQIKDIGLNKQYNGNFTMGFNNNFIKTAIADKISRIFLFFAFSLIIITVSWRLRSNYTGGKIPVIHYPLFLTIPLFIYFLVELLHIITTSLYSMLALTTDFYLMLILCFVFNIIITFLSIIIISGNKV